MGYKIFTQIGDAYRNEEGNAAHERPFVLSMHGYRLRKAMVDAEQARVASNGPKVASAGANVAALKEFHSRQQTLTTWLADANEEVVRTRQFLVRLGAVVDAKGNVDLKKSAAVVLYDKDLQAQELTAIRFAGGLLQLAKSKKPLDTTQMVTAFSGPGYGIYVMSGTGTIHVTSHSVGARHHSSLLNGAPVACAGEIKAVGGRIVSLSNKSGHYQPNIDHLLQVLHQLEKNFVPLTFTIRYNAGGSWYTYADTATFLRENGLSDDQYDYNNLVHAYPDVLNDAALLAKYGWAWRPGQGVYSLGTGARVDSSTVRQTLNSAGITGTRVIKLGVGR